MTEPNEEKIAIKGILMVTLVEILAFLVFCLINL